MTSSRSIARHVSWPRTGRGRGRDRQRHPLRPDGRLRGPAQCRMGGPIWEGPIEDVRVRDFSPPLAELKAHFAPLVRPDVGTIEIMDASQDPAVRPEPGIIQIPAASRKLVDQEADLRMYRVRHVDWPEPPTATSRCSFRGEGKAQWSPRLESSMSSWIGCYR